MRPEKFHLETLKAHITRKFGRSLRTSTDFSQLAQDIFNHTHRTIGATTLKRVFGYVCADHGTSFSTLSHLASYIGYNDWDSFCNEIDKKGDGYATSGFTSDAIIVSSSLPLRAILMLEWAGRKRCRIKKIKEPDVFRIEEAENIKLLCGDIGKIENVMPGYPLVIRDCNRGGQDIGTYTGAIKEGIHSITPICNSN